jgi:hypothetical protein
MQTVSQCTQEAPYFNFASLKYKQCHSAMKTMIMSDAASIADVPTFSMLTHIHLLYVGWVKKGRETFLRKRARSLQLMSVRLNSVFQISNEQDRHWSRDSYSPHTLHSKLQFGTDAKIMGKWLQSSLFSLDVDSCTRGQGIIDSKCMLQQYQMWRIFGYW